MFFWANSYGDPPGIYGQRFIDSTPLWGSQGKLIISSSGLLLTKSSESIQLGYPSSPCISDQNGGAIIFGAGQIQRVDSLGNLLWISPPQTKIIGVAPYNVTATEDSGAIGCDITWGGKGPYKYFYLVKVTSTGSLPWGESLRVWTSNVWDTTNADYFTAIASDYYKGAVTVFAPLNERGDKDIRVLRTDSSGQNVWEREVCQTGGDQDYPLIIHEPHSKGYFLVWQDSRSGNWDIYGTYLDSLGRVGIYESDIEPLAEHPLLLSIVPNPFNDKVRIEYQTSLKEISLKVYDCLGRMIRILPKGRYLKPGVYATTWDGRSEFGALLPPGIYFLEVSEGERVRIEKLVLIK